MGVPDAAHPSVNICRTREALAFAHRVRAAFLVICLRRFRLNFLARPFPPSEATLWTYRATASSDFMAPPC
jgi:hypothetical protein